MIDPGHFTHRPCQNCRDKDVEIERLEAALRQIAKQSPPGAEAYIASQALAENDER